MLTLSLEQKTKLSRTNKQNQVYHENRLVWHTIAIHYYSSKQTKKATIISANYTLNQNVTARFFISSFFQDKYYSNYYIYETFLRYSNQNKNKKAENHGEQIQSKEEDAEETTTKLSRTKTKWKS